MDQERIASCIEACNECAEACEYCADACLDEDDVEDLVECVRLDRDCADLCRLVAAFLARGSSFSPAIAAACAEACDACAAECDEHEMEHCRACAEACRDCAAECRRMMESDAPQSRGVATHA
ncbi:MAG: four-helix bundle copper-binding protein [Labilithrix sp.]|nr:four-helix bundle copper-binding protein [Labilithrix sp.]